MQKNTKSNFPNNCPVKGLKSLNLSRKIFISFKFLGKPYTRNLRWLINYEEILIDCNIVPEADVSILSQRCGSSYPVKRLSCNDVHFLRTSTSILSLLSLRPPPPFYKNLWSRAAVPLTATSSSYSLFSLMRREKTEKNQIRPHTDTQRHTHYTKTQGTLRKFYDDSKGGHRSRTIFGTAQVSE